MKRIVTIAILVATTLAFLAGDLLAQAGSNSIAVALKGSGQVTLTRAGKTEPLKFGTALNSDDVVKTGPDGAITIMFTDDKSLIKLKASTSVTIAGRRDATGSIAKRVGLEIGEVFAKVEKQKGTLEVATPTSVASVKGTEFWVVYDAQGNTFVTTLEGLVALRNSATGEEVEIRVAQRCELLADGTIKVVNVPVEELPADPDPGAPSAPLKSIEIEIIDDEGNKQTIKVQYTEPAPNDNK